MILILIFYLEPILKKVMLTILTIILLTCKRRIWQGYGLKVPAIETRKTPITHVLGIDEPLNVPAIETRKTTINICRKRIWQGMV